MSILHFVDQDRQFIEWEMSSRRPEFYPKPSDGTPAKPSSPNMQRFVFDKPVDYRIIQVDGRYRLTSSAGHGGWILCCHDLAYDPGVDCFFGACNLGADAYAGGIPGGIDYRVSIAARDSRLEFTYFEVTSGDGVIPIGHARV